MNDAKIKAMEDALSAAITALNDWSNTIAPEYYDLSAVEETYNRLRNGGGTLYYVSLVIKQCSDAKGV